MKQTLVLRTNSGGFALISAENSQSFQPMASYISSIIATKPPCLPPSVEDYIQDLKVMTAASQRFGMGNITFLDYRWGNEDTIKMFFGTGKRPNLGDLPDNIRAAFQSL